MILRQFTTEVPPPEPLSERCVVEVESIVVGYGRDAIDEAVRQASVEVRKQARLRGVMPRSPVQMKTTPCDGGHTHVIAALVGVMSDA